MGIRILVLNAASGRCLEKDQDIPEMGRQSNEKTGGKLPGTKNTVWWAVSVCAPMCMHVCVHECVCECWGCLGMSLQCVCGGGRRRMRTTVRNGTEGRRKETDGKQSVNAKNLKSDKCLFYTVLITGKNADGNSQISQAGTASVDLGRVLGCALLPGWLARPGEV